jgi:hypothetical protein
MVERQKLDGILIRTAAKAKWAKVLSIAARSRTQDFVVPLGACEQEVKPDWQV